MTSPMDKHEGLLALAHSIEAGHARVVHLDANTQWAPYQTDVVVRALRTAAQAPSKLDEADPTFCAMVNAARAEYFRLKGFHPYTADIIAMLKAALVVSSTHRPAPIEPQAVKETDEVLRLRAAIDYACDLLAERTYGSSARSPGHNARLHLETALAVTRPSPLPSSSLPARGAQVSFDTPIVSHHDSRKVGP